jgi:hypothetical protein
MTNPPSIATTALNCSDLVGSPRPTRVHAKSGGGDAVAVAVAVAVANGVAGIVASGAADDDGVGDLDEGARSLGSSRADGDGDPVGTGLAMQPARATAAIALKSVADDGRTGLGRDRPPRL